MIGIYLIENKINHKKYIGQSSDIVLRWYHHKSDLRSNTHHNRHLQSAWNKYGEDSFEFSILEECEINQLNNKEIFWITHFDSCNQGYNLDNGGNGVRGYKHSQEEIEKMRRIQNPLIVLQFDTEFNLIKKWIGGACHVDKDLGYTKESILSRCNHTIRKMTPYKDSYWVYENEYAHKDFNWENYLHNRKLINIDKDKEVKNVKRICQYDLNRNLIKTWDSLSEIRKSGYTTNQISSILHHYKGKKTSSGYIWCYEDYDFSDGYFDTLDNYKNKAIENRKRKIYKLDPVTKEIIECFNSITEASESVGIACSCICVAAKKDRLSAGFKWKYA